MKLSDFLSASNDKTASEVPTTSESKTSFPSQPLKQPIDPAKPAVDIADIEQKIRKELQAQFQVDLAKIRGEMEEALKAQLHLEKQKLLDQVDELKRHQQKVEGVQEKIKQEKETDLLNQKKQLEVLLQKTLEEEKRKLSEKFNAEIQASQDNVKKLTKLLEVREKELDENRQSLEILRQPSDHSLAKPIEVTDEIPEVIHSIQEEVEETKKSDSKPAFGLKPINVIEENILPTVILNADPEAERAAKECQDDLIKLGEAVFEDATHGRPLDLLPLRNRMSSFISLVQLRDLEVMRLALEPYGSESPFAYHAINTCFLSVILGLEFTFTIEQLTDLAMASFLHDIGLVNVREDLNYPKKLTPQLEKEILNHPIKGAEMLKGSLSQVALDAVAQHHEIGNGKGYPRGLMEDDIHIFSSIIHVVDSFEALIHQRPYRPVPLEVHEAMKQLIDTGRGIYDRNVLKAMMVRIGLYPLMSYVELSNKQIGIVLRQNRQQPLSPSVQIEYDENGHKLSKPMVIDLSKSQFVHITASVKKEMREGFSTSRFAATEPVVQGVKLGSKKDSSDLIQHIISIFLILTVILILVYVVVKI